MERLSKAFNENRRTMMAVGGTLMLGAASAYMFYRRRQFPAAQLAHRWRDPHFKSENV